MSAPFNPVVTIDSVHQYKPELDEAEEGLWQEVLEELRREHELKHGQANQHTET